MCSPLKIAVMLAAATATASSQAPDTSRARPRGVRFVGNIANITTTRPIESADVRIIFIDSIQSPRAGDKGAGEIFVDSARSRIGITDTGGVFTIRNVEPGHYLVNVRRIGFTPFEGLLTIDTSAVEMQLAMTQVMSVLPEVKITATRMDRAAQVAENSGFASRQHAATTGQFIGLGEIQKKKFTFLTQMLESYGIGSSSTFLMDRIPVDWDLIKEYPPDFIVGIEIYRNMASAPIQFSPTSKGAQAFGDGGTGGIQPKVVLLWTYVP